MKIIKQVFNNFLWILFTLFVSFTLVNFIESFWKTYSDTDFLWGTFIVFLSTTVYAFIFIVIHSCLSIRQKSIFKIKKHKFLLLIPLISSLSSEIFDFRWFGFVKNIDDALYLNYIVLCIVLLLINILFVKNIKK